MDTLGVFHRHNLAARLTSQLLGTDPLSPGGRSGVFMSAPRRTGKSTFLRADLIPTAEAAGAVVVYVDLWVDKPRDPAELIAEAVGDTLARVATPAQKIGAVAAKIKKLTGKLEVTGFKAEFGFERESIGKPDGTTLAKAFEALHEKTGKPIVFILDEAQHAQTTDAGSNALFALKAARDALNLTAATPQLAILATGSLRGKLSNLILRKNQAFYGATITDFPTLGRDFMVHLAQQMLGHRFSPDTMPSPDKMMRAFELVASRPEEMANVIRDAVVHATPDLGDAMIEVAEARRDALLEELRRQLRSLPSLQQAILHRMHHVPGGEPFEPFVPESMQAYARFLGAEPTKVQVQRGLESLVRDGLLWRSARGMYDVDEEMLPQHFSEVDWQELLEEFQPIPDENPVGRDGQIPRDAVPTAKKKLNRPG